MLMFKSIRNLFARRTAIAPASADFEAEQSALRSIVPPSTMLAGEEPKFLLPESSDYYRQLILDFHNSNSNLREELLEEAANILAKTAGLHLAVAALAEISRDENISPVRREQARRKLILVERQRDDATVAAGRIREAIERADWTRILDRELVLSGRSSEGSLMTEAAENAARLGEATIISKEGEKIHSTKMTERGSHRDLYRFRGKWFLLSFHTRPDIDGKQYFPEFWFATDSLNQMTDNELEVIATNE
jgi:hypothetical protein